MKFHEKITAGNSEKTGLFAGLGFHSEKRKPEKRRLDVLLENQHPRPDAEIKAPVSEKTREGGELRAYKIGIRMLAVTTVFLGFTTASLGFLAINLQQDLRVVPVVVTMSDRDNVLVDAQSLSSTARGAEVIIRSLMCQYLIKRNNVIPHLGMFRQAWDEGGYIQNASSEDVYDQFRQAAFPHIKRYQEERWIRLTQILSEPVHIASQGESLIYRIDIRVQDFERDHYDLHRLNPAVATPIAQTDFTVNLTVSFRENRVLNSLSFYRNPIGLVVMDYIAEPINSYSKAPQKPVVCGRDLIENYKDMTL